MRYLALALALLAGCGRVEPPPIAAVPEVKAPPVEPPPEMAGECPSVRKRAQEEPIVRRSQHQPELESFPVELKSVVAAESRLVAFVDDPANVETRAKAMLKEKGHGRIARVPGTGEATLYVLSCGLQLQFARLTAIVDRRSRLIMAKLVDPAGVSGRRAATAEAPLLGQGIRLGALEAGSWIVEIHGENRDTIWFGFIAGPGGPEPKGESDLAAFLMWPGENPDHDLVSFASRLGDFESARTEVLAGRKPAPLMQDDDLMLYVLWGQRLGRPDASAAFDRKTSSIRVTTRWTGGGGMKDTRTAPYAGYGFALGKLEPGTYSVEVVEMLPTKADERRVTRKMTFEVRARP